MKEGGGREKVKEKSYEKYSLFSNNGEKANTYQIKKPIIPKYVMLT